MEYTYYKLHRRICEKYGSIYKFADVLNLSRNALYRKMSGNGAWRQQEIADCCRLLSIPENEIGLYFFTKEV